VLPIAFGKCERNSTQQQKRKRDEPLPSDHDTAAYLNISLIIPHVRRTVLKLCVTAVEEV
jgi:hypothetical protein